MPLDGNRMRQLRQRHNLNQAELADLIGVSMQQVTRYEGGKSDPSGDILAKMAVELGCTVDYLLGLVNEPSGTYDQLAPDERQLLELYRSGRITLAMFLRVMEVDSDKDRKQDPGIPGVDISS